MNFTYTFFKALLIFCHCSALFSSVLFLKIIVNNVLYCCTVNLSRHNYFLANKNLLFYRCLFVYIIKRTLHSGLKIWILFSHGKNNILLTRCADRKLLFCHSKIKFISSRHHVIPSMNISWRLEVHKGYSSIPVSGKRSDKDNYCPISVISIIGKVFERIIYYQLFANLSDQNILSKHQSGIRVLYSVVIQPY